MKHALVIALVVMTALVGCNSDEGGETAAPTVEVNLVNTHCPIMGHEVTDDGGRTDYKEGTVGFCCPGCIDTFNALDDAAKDKALATKGAGIEEAEADAGGEEAAEEGGEEAAAAAGEEAAEEGGSEAEAAGEEAE